MYVCTTQLFDISVPGNVSHLWQINCHHWEPAICLHAVHGCISEQVKSEYQLQSDDCGSEKNGKWARIITVTIVRRVLTTRIAKNMPVDYRIKSLERNTTLSSNVRTIKIALCSTFFLFPSVVLIISYSSIFVWHNFHPSAARNILRDEANKKPCARFPSGQCQFGPLCRFSHYTPAQTLALRQQGSSTFYTVKNVNFH